MVEVAAPIVAGSSFGVVEALHIAVEVLHIAEAVLRMAEGEEPRRVVVGERSQTWGGVG